MEGGSCTPRAARGRPWWQRLSGASSAAPRARSGREDAKREPSEGGRLALRVVQGRASPRRPPPGASQGRPGMRRRSIQARAGRAQLGRDQGQDQEFAEMMSGSDAISQKLTAWITRSSPPGHEFWSCRRARGVMNIRASAYELQLMNFSS